MSFCCRDEGDTSPSIYCMDLASLVTAVAAAKQWEAYVTTLRVRYTPSIYEAL